MSNKIKYKATIKYEVMQNSKILSFIAILGLPLFAFFMLNYGIYSQIAHFYYNIRKYLLLKKEINTKEHADEIGQVVFGMIENSTLYNNLNRNYWSCIFRSKVKKLKSIEVEFNDDAIQSSES